jgi:hypothetical protein
VYPRRLEKYQQLSHRHAPAFVRHVLKAFRQLQLTAPAAASQLGLSRSRLYTLFADYLRALALRKGAAWTPAASGGNHASPWPQPVLDLLHKRLACTPSCSSTFAASEVLRLHAFKLDRAQVRRWARQNNGSSREVCFDRWLKGLRWSCG